MAREQAGRQSRRIWHIGARLAAALALGLVLGNLAGGGIALGASFPPTHERAGSLTPEGVKLYRLPDDWRTDSGKIDQDAIVAQQKKRREVINEVLGIRLQMAETSHYLLFSDAGRTVSRYFLKWCEQLYRGLLVKFALPKGAKVWDGKCVLILFRDRRQFESYARRYDGMKSASRAGAYFGIEAHGQGAPNLTHICVPIDTDDSRRLQELFVHEGTHAFFELYRTQGRLPLWLHEGLAEFMTTVNDRELRPRKWKPAAQVARSGRPIRPIFQVPMGGTLSVAQYRVAFTLVDFLLKAGRPKFKTFVHHLKDGTGQEEALKDAYGWTFEDLEKRWRLYLTRAGP